MTIYLYKCRSTAFFRIIISYVDLLYISLYNVRDERNTMLNDGVAPERDDFYTFISKLVDKDKSMVEFFIAVLPAIFIDVISALCLNLALFIRRKK